MSTQTRSASATGADALSALDPAPNGESNIFASVDFAHLVGNHLLVYGWILGFADQIDNATIAIGDLEIDLGASCVRLSRPDVSQHFSSGTSDEHGFYALLDLHHLVPEADSLLLAITSRPGESYENRWKIQRHSRVLNSLPEPDLTTLKSLLRSLPGLEGSRLRRLLSESSDAGKLVEAPTALPPSIDFGIHLCCVLEERILVVYGWLSDPTHELNTVQLTLGDRVVDLLKLTTAFRRLGVKPETSIYSGIQPSGEPGFILVESLAAAQDPVSEAILALTSRTGNAFYLSEPVSRNIYDSRSSLFSLLAKLDVQSAMEFLEKILLTTTKIPKLDTLRTLLEVSHDRLAEQLPTSIEFTSKRLRHWLNVDKAIFIPDKGLYISGWFHAEHCNSSQVTFHCGQMSCDMSKVWVRHTRRDVTTFLEAAGVQTQESEHGFNCYVRCTPEGHACWIAVTSESGEARRLRIPRVGNGQSEMQTVRSLLATFRSEDRNLRTLLDQHVGPAVEAEWSKRTRFLPEPLLERFGPEPLVPEVSIIVPLYGRWDFAEFQMAQFANDVSFSNVDLIYVVDDPSIYDNFHSTAEGLFGIYGISFALAFSGRNLGFARANNFAVQFARGKFILLMNSDVLPKYRGWLSELLRIYKTLESPGLLGVKLIYEDGTLQHAGIEFRRHSPWGGLWINDHPFKGQMSEHLRGTREVDAVTAACVLIDADLFRLLDGFSEDYIIGDFEDSDLCLRARNVRGTGIT